MVIVSILKRSDAKKKKVLWSVKLQHNKQETQPIAMDANMTRIAMLKNRLILV
jgi:hypothetical protein